MKFIMKRSFCPLIEQSSVNFCITICLFIILSSPFNTAIAGSNLIPLPSPGFIVEQTRSDLNRPARVHNKSYSGPIIDTHAHLYPPRERDANITDINKGQLKKILKILKKTGVKLVIFMPTPNDGIRRNQELGVVKRKMIRDMKREKIRLFCGSNYITNWLDFAHGNGYTQGKLQNVLKRLAKDIDSGTYSGVGEIGNYHFDKGYKQQHVIEFPTNFEPFLKIIDLIAEKGIWLDLHAEPVGPKGKSYEKEVFGGIELLFRRNPHLKLIYSHTAMTNPINARRILKKYPNIMMNVKIETKHKKWKNLAPIVNTKGELYEVRDKFLKKCPKDL